MNYIQHSVTWTPLVDGSVVVSDYVTHEDHYKGIPGIEEQIKRLTNLVGLLSDKAGINLLEILHSSDLNHKYEYVADNES